MTEKGKLVIESTSASEGFYRYFPVSERDREWGLFVTTTGETRSRPGEPYPPAGHSKGYSFQWRDGRVLHDFVVVYISRGSGWFESRYTRRQRLDAGSVFLLFPGVWHRYMPDPETGWDDHWVAFDGDLARRWAKNRFLLLVTPFSYRARTKRYWRSTSVSLT